MEFERPSPPPSSEQAAALIGAIERFLADLAPAGVAAPERRDRWLEEALLEGVRRYGEPGGREPWLNS